MAYWLIKSEPDCFSFADLCDAPGRTTGWDGVRNFQARNFLRRNLERPGIPVSNVNRADRLHLCVRFSLKQLDVGPRAPQHLEQR